MTLVRKAATLALGEGFARVFGVVVYVVIASLSSVSLAESVIAAEGYDMAPTALAGRVQVTVDGTTGLVKVGVSDSDPEVAADLTNAIVNRFAADARAAQEEMLAAAIASAEERLAKARERVVPLDVPAGANQEFLGESSYDQAAALVDTLQMGAATQVDPVIVNREAVAPAPIGDSGALKTVLFGLFAGLALGLVLALLLEYLARAGSSTEVQA